MAQYEHLTIYQKAMDLAMIRRMDRAIPVTRRAVHFQAITPVTILELRN